MTQESNGPQAPLPAPDFNQEFQRAQATGDFDFVLDTARKSHKMLVDFRDAIHRAAYAGKDAMVVAMGVNFLENMIANSAGQLSALKQSEKQTREALRDKATAVGMVPDDVQEMKRPNGSPHA